MQNMLATDDRFIINHDVPPFVALFFGKKWLGAFSCSRQPITIGGYFY
jgi:hypothetical protein